MALSYQNYTGDNTTTTFSIPFTFQNTSEISVTVDGVAETGLTFPSTSTVQLTSAPATGAIVQVRRTTDLTARAVDFTSGSVLTEEDLDNSSIQVFHAAQEANDRVGDTIGLDTTNRWDAGGNIIKNVGDPVNNTDAVNKQFLSTNLPDINTVAGIETEVTTVAGIASTLTANLTDIQNAEEHAQEAKDYATKTDGQVQENGANTGNYSSKAWATGGTGVTDTAGSGPAKDWAVETTGQVDGTEYSSKEYAIGTQAGNTAGSSKQWALGGGAGFDRDTAVTGSGLTAEYSAKYWANQAANSVQDFQDVYYGSFTSDANAEDYQLNTNQGSVNVGDLYFNSSDNVVRVRTFSGWQDAATDTSSFATNGFAIAMAIAL